MKFAALAGAGVAYGLLAALVFRRVEVRGNVNRMIAHVLSFRLFLDEPGLVFRAQVELARENLRMLRRIAIPCVVLGVVFAVSYAAMDGYFGHRRLRTGESAVVSAPAEVAMPAGIVQETPAVRIARLHQVAWRVRATREFVGRFPESVAVRYPRTEVFGVHWMAWFLVFSTVAASLGGRIVRSSITRIG